MRRLTHPLEHFFHSIALVSLSLNFQHLSYAVHAAHKFLVLDDAMARQHIEDKRHKRQCSCEGVAESALKSHILSTDDTNAVAYPQENKGDADQAKAHLQFSVLVSKDSPEVERAGEQQQDKQRPYPSEIPCAVGHHVPEVEHHRVAPHSLRNELSQRKAKAHYRSDECQKEIDGLNALPHNYNSLDGSRQNMLPSMNSWVASSEGFGNFS